MRIKYARKLSFFFVVYRNVSFFLFPCWDIIKYLIAYMLTTVVFELVQQFYHATEIGNVVKCGQCMRWLAIAHSIQNKDNFFW